MSGAPTSLQSRWQPGSPCPKAALGEGLLPAHAWAVGKHQGLTSWEHQFLTIDASSLPGMGCLKFSCCFWTLPHATNCVTQVCHIRSPCPCGRTLLTCTSAGDTQTIKGRSGSVSMGSLGNGAHKVLLSISGGYEV